MTLMDIEKNGKHIYWRTKCLVGTLTLKLFKSNEEIMTKNSYAVTLLVSHLKILFEHKKGYVNPETLSKSIQYVTHGTFITKTKERLKLYVDTLIYSTIIPISYFTPKDMEVFEYEPVEYIRNFYDFGELSDDPRDIVQDLLISIVERVH